MPAHAPTLSVRSSVVPLDLSLIRRPAWRIRTRLARLRSGRLDETTHLHHDIDRIRLHPLLPGVVRDTLVAHLHGVARAHHLTDPHHDAILGHVLRPRAPGWQLTGVVALLVSAGRPHEAERLLAQLPTPLKQPAARRAWSAERVLRTGVWGQGARSRVVVHPRLAHTVPTTVPIIRSLVSRPWRLGVETPHKLHELVDRLPQRNHWRGAVWAGLLTAGPHLRDLDHALAAMPHPTARDHLAALAVQAAIHRHRPTLAADLLHTIEREATRADTAGRVADLLHARGDLDQLDPWLSRLACGPHDHHIALATVMHLSRTVEVTRLALDRSAWTALHDASRALDHTRDRWSLFSRPGAAQRLGMLVALSGGRSTGVRRHMHAAVVRQTLSARVTDPSVGAAMRIARMADGDSVVSDALLSTWLTRPSTQAGPPVEPLARASLQGAVPAGFLTAWEGVLQRASTRRDPREWLDDFRVRKGRWPTPWELSRVARAPVPRRTPATALQVPTLTDPLSIALTALGWPACHATDIRKGRPWTRLIDDARSRSIAPDTVLDRVEGRWPKQVPRNLDAAGWTRLSTAWTDPTTLVFRERGPGRWTPSRAIWTVRIALLGGTTTPVALVDPIGTSRRPEEVLRHIARTCAHLGFVALATPPELVAHAGSVVQKSVRIRQLSVPSTRRSLDGWGWIDLHQGPHQMH